ncbi:MAG TPA: DUF3592 domain-containing protein [Acidimicrobiales bacterium]|nr:DUF3592 domain-containing protein [Acidimicrobiales bacterium]
MKLPDQLRAFRARPLPWLVAGVALTACLMTLDAFDARADRAWARSALAVEGEVGAGYDGSAYIPVVYRHPVTDERIEHTVYRWAGPVDLEPGDRIALEVDPDDPEDAAVAGDRRPYVTPFDYAPYVLVPLFFLLWRWWSVHASMRRAGRDEVAFAMLGAIAPGSRFRRRPVLHLYALDAPAGARSLCATRLLATAGCPLAGPAFPVQVKGVPRQWGRVVARAGADGDVLWPAGTTRPHRAWPRPEGIADPVPPAPIDAAERPKLPPPPYWAPRRRLNTVGTLWGALVAGLVLGAGVTATLLVRSASDGPEDGWIDTVGEVVRRGTDTVDITYRAEGAERTVAATVLYPEDYTVGRRYPVTFDPDQPSHVRLREEAYDLSYPLFFAWLPAAMAASALAVVVRRRRRTRDLADHGPWSRVDLWHVSGGGSLIGTRAAGYVRAEIPPERRLPWSHAVSPQAGLVRVVGRPEPGEVVAVVDRIGATVPHTRRLRVPRSEAVVPPPEAVVPPLDASTGAPAPYIIRGVWSWFDPGLIGVFAVALIAGPVGAVVPSLGFVLAALGAAALVALLARIKVVIDEDGIAVCDGLLTRRLRWVEIVSIRDGRRSPVLSMGRADLPCLAIEVPGEVWPLRPLATMRTSGRAVQRLVEAVGPYAPPSVRMRRANDGGEWAPSTWV